VHHGGARLGSCLCSREGLGSCVVPASGAPGASHGHGRRPWPGKGGGPGHALPHGPSKWQGWRAGPPSSRHTAPQRAPLTSPIHDSGAPASRFTRLAVSLACRVPGLQYPWLAVSLHPWLAVSLACRGARNPIQPRARAASGPPSRVYRVWPPGLIEAILRA
jgi:hypothetical protein